MIEFMLNLHCLQRTFVGVDYFRIFQEVYLRTDDPRVVNVVKFSESVGELKVEVIALSMSPELQLFRELYVFGFSYLTASAGDVFVTNSSISFITIFSV